MSKFTIKGSLPNMNEIIDAGKKHWSEYSRMKRAYTELVHYSCLKIPKMTGPVSLSITWYCKDKRIDPDNITAGQKFILDGLVSAGRLNNDGWKDIASINHTYRIDKRNPRIEVELQQIEG